jgi:hypothetical protein
MALPRDANTGADKLAIYGQPAGIFADVWAGGAGALGVNAVHEQPGQQTERATKQEGQLLHEETLLRAEIHRFGRRDLIGWNTRQRPHHETEVKVEESTNRRREMTRFPEFRDFHHPSNNGAFGSSRGSE